MKSSESEKIVNDASPESPESLKAQKPEDVQLELDFPFFALGSKRQRLLSRGVAEIESPEDDGDYYEFRGRW